MKTEGWGSKTEPEVENVSVLKLVGRPEGMAQE
jgi:hypothetical protein